MARLEVAAVAKEACPEQGVQERLKVHARSEPILVLGNCHCGIVAQTLKRIAPRARAKAVCVANSDVDVANVNRQENPGNDLQARPYTN